MNLISVTFFIFASILLLFLSRRWAALPLLMAACYITIGQVEKISVFHFTVIRLLIFIGIIRVILKAERPAGSLNSLDKLVILWGIWALIAALFHKDPEATLINRLGRVYDVFGIYFLMRCFFQDKEEIKSLIGIIAMLLFPVALEMLNEQISHKNLFSIFGGVGEIPSYRMGHFRSQGPFRHPILAGTVGAVCVPLMIGIWSTRPKLAKLGLVACLIMVVTSASSGPILSLIAGLFALILWRWRHLRKQFVIMGIIGYILLDLVMKAPAYYLIARVDIISGSTGWHRARLIESAIEHIREWWIIGTDYTRHWMPTGVSWSPDHTDLVNQYIGMGVLGGLPLMILFILNLWKGFKYIGQSLNSAVYSSTKEEFFIWSLGASLFAHAVTLTSVSFFDQSFIFLYLNLAMIGSLHWSDRREPSLINADKF